MLRKVGSNRVLLLLMAVLISQWLPACSSLCTKRLFLYRDTPAKRKAPADMALLISDPQMAQAIFPGAGNFPGGGCQWAPEQPAHESDAYRLSLDSLDGKPVYQGMCLDTTPTYACEVRPGARQLGVRIDLFGPWGRESLKEEARVNLEQGRCYFLRPDCEKLKDRQLVLKMEPLPSAYTPELRARVVAWERQHSKGRSLEE